MTTNRIYGNRSIVILICGILLGGYYQAAHNIAVAEYQQAGQPLPVG